MCVCVLMCIPYVHHLTCLNKVIYFEAISVLQLMSFARVIAVEMERVYMIVTYLAIELV